MTGESPAWRLDTTDLPEHERTAAWVDAMARLRLPLVRPLQDAPMAGTVTVLQSPIGLHFARLESDALTIEGRSEQQAEGLWLAVVLEGEAQLSGPGIALEIGPAQLVLGVNRVASSLSFSDRYRLLLVQFPAIAVAPRLLAPPGAPLLGIDASLGSAAVFRAMLAAVGERLDDLDAEALRPIELSAIEFLVATLAAQGGQQARGGADGARAALLQRILQRLETLLGQSDLTMSALAQDAGISPRYLRRLLSAQDLNFAQVLRERRLARCHADLISPLHAQLSVSEIAFRWGFNDAAHFSRAFRSRYGLSPREHRRGGAGGGGGGRSAD